MAHEHDGHWDQVFTNILMSNGFSAAAAGQIVREEMITDQNDRKQLYIVLREFILPENPSPPKSRFFRHGGR